MFLFDGLIATLQPAPVLAMLGSSLLGVLIGALPGLNPVMAIALLLPLTYSMDPWSRSAWRRSGSWPATTPSTDCSRRS